ncbi:MAG: hypothetical protein IJ844_02985 [Prevotella sp.]|nr:hypothetical protein [Prevotella sp.]
MMAMLSFAHDFEVGGIYYWITSSSAPYTVAVTYKGTSNSQYNNEYSAEVTIPESVSYGGKTYSVRLVYCFEKKGVLNDAEDEDSVISSINRKDFERYINDGTIAGGMIPKIENSLQAVEAGVAQVIITRADSIDGKSGTVIEP